jgi:hypothetical protein
MKQGEVSDLRDALEKKPRYAYALCFSGLDDGPKGDLPFLLPSQLANMIPSMHFKSLSSCIETGDIVFDLFAYVSIGKSARPSQDDKDKYDAAITRVAKAAGVRKVSIVHGVDEHINPHQLDSAGESSIMGSSHGQLQNWLQQVLALSLEAIASHRVASLSLSTPVAREAASILHGSTPRGEAGIQI